MKKKIYFLSDFHLGIHGATSSTEREKKLLLWLDEVSQDAEEIYLVGDVFDYWYEYKKVVPKGYVRLLGKLANLTDNGVKVYFFTGNHDMWMFRYLTDELNIPVYREAIRRKINGKNFIIGHGDGLGPGDHGYKMIKALFSNRLAQWAFRQIHPDTGIRLMKFFSAKSRQFTREELQSFNPENEWLVSYAESVIQKEQIDYLIFGHRHLAIDYLLSDGKSRYINLGDWLYFYSYAVFDGNDVVLHFYHSPNPVLISNHIHHNKYAAS
jgi:UDP-2,3-diacylglucosamine hydrolase